MRLEQKERTFKLSRGDSPSLHLVVLEQIHHHCVQRLGIAALRHSHLLEFGHVAGQGSPGVAAIKGEKGICSVKINYKTYKGKEMRLWLVFWPD